MTLGDVLRRSTEHLAAKGSGTPRLDAELLLGRALGLQRIELYMHLDRPLTSGELDAMRTLVVRRAKGEPLQYVLGEWGFRRLTLGVDRRALIPRPETEIVVERSLALMAERESPRVLDVGTGSAAIALAIADECESALVTAIDISQAALELAGENVQRTGLVVDLFRHDFMDGLPAGPWDLVVANLPYIDPADTDTLSPEVRDWEPTEALYGIGIHDVVARAAREVLAQRGALVLEVGDGQAAEVAESLDTLGYGDIRITRDLAGRERVVEGGR